MRARLRMLVAILVAALATPAVLLASAGTSAASAPARVEGVLPSCVTNASGTDTMTFVSPLSGVAVFFGQSPVAVTGVTGGTTPERILSAEYRTTQAGTTHIVSVTGPPSTPCTVFYAVDETPANDDVTAPEVLSGAAGTVRGSTRAANNPFGDPRPTPGAQRVVWYEWSGPTGTATITAEPLPGGGITSAANGATSTGVAVYDAADLSAPLQVGGDGIAYQEDGGSGGSVTLPVVSGTDYLVAVFSAGGTGIFANQFGYLAVGAFDLTYDMRCRTRCAGRRRGHDIIDTGDDRRARQRRRPRRRAARDHRRAGAQQPELVCRGRSGRPDQGRVHARLRCRQLRVLHVRDRGRRRRHRSGAGLRVRRRRDPVVGDRGQSVTGRLRRGAARQDGRRRCDDHQHGLRLRQPRDRRRTGRAVSVRRDQPRRRVPLQSARPRLLVRRDRPLLVDRRCECRQPRDAVPARRLIRPGCGGSPVRIVGTGRSAGHSERCSDRARRRGPRPGGLSSSRWKRCTTTSIPTTTS